MPAAIAPLRRPAPTTPAFGSIPIGSTVSQARNRFGGTKPKPSAPGRTDGQCRQRLRRCADPPRRRLLLALFRSDQPFLKHVIVSGERSPSHPLLAALTANAGSDCAAAPTRPDDACFWLY